MLNAFDPSDLTGPAGKIFAGPPKMREMAAKGVALGVAPHDLLLLLVALSTTAEPAIADTAKATLDALPPQVLAGALAVDLHPLAIHALATRQASNVATITRLLSMPRIDDETVIELAKHSTEEVSELIATNEERLLACPKIIEALYLNKHTRMSTADRLVELAVRNRVEVNLPAWKEAAIAIQSELIMEPSDEANPDDEFFRRNMQVADSLRQDGDEIEDTFLVDEAEETAEQLKDKYVPLYREIALMTNSQKIRFASIGTPEAILILVNDASPLVALAAAKSPQVNEAVVEKVVKRRNVSPDVLSTFGQRPEFLRRLSTKRDLLRNPKTPPSLAMRLINHFQAHELERLGNDKNVSGSVRQVIRNYLDRKKR